MPLLILMAVVHRYDPMLGCRGAGAAGGSTLHDMLAAAAGCPTDKLCYWHTSLLQLGNVAKTSTTIPC